MMRLLIVLTLFTAHTIMAQNARALLKIVGEENSIKVGNTYKMELTIVPFRTASLSVATFLDKTFLDYFYVTKVEGLEQSENNQEAVVVNLKAIVLKKFEAKPLYIWSLGDRNIPVEMKTIDVVDTKLTIKEFQLYETGEGLTKSSFFVWSIVFVFFVLVLLIILRVRKKPIDENKINRQVLLLKLKNATTHDELEEIYKNRESYLELFETNKESSKNLNDILELYKLDQFSSKWRNSDITKIIESKNKLLEEAKLGV